MRIAGRIKENILNVLMVGILVFLFGTTANAASQTLFVTQVPAQLAQSDGAGVNYELGILFQSSTTGQISSIRFWKDGNETGTHTGHIWSGTGQLLASVAFVNETSSGWQQQVLTAPLTIAAKTNYVVSVNTGNTYYVATSPGLASQVINGYLTSVVGNNGVYGSTGKFPTNTWQTSNYFRDVVFIPGTITSMAPSITTQPAGKTITAGQTATFNVAATGTSPMTYQWKKNSTAISGATSSSYTTPAEVTADNKAQFSVTVTNSVGNATSNAAVLTVSPAAVAPAIITQPSSQTVTAGQTATFNVGATGTAPITYVWMKNGAAISGATSSSYTTPATTSSDNNAQFTVKVSNSAGSATSSSATLMVAGTSYSVSGSVSPSASGTGATLTLSGTASATATANSLGNYTFTGLANGNYTVTPTKTGFTFSPSSAPASVNNTNVTVATFTATANTAGQTLFTTQVPALLAQSDGPSVNYELGTMFRSNTSGLITSIRFWKDGNETGTHTGRLWSATGQMLASVAFVNETASGWQQQALTAPLAIAANTSYVVTVNTGNTYYVAANSGLASQVSNGNLSSVVGNNGVYGPTGTFPTNSWKTSNYFRDVVFVPGAITSMAPSITTQPASKTITAGQTATFNVAATGTSPMTYQWKKNSTAISGATSSTYTTPVTTASDNAAQFTVVISNTAGSATSNAATLTVSTVAVAPAITTQPVSKTVTAGQTATFSVAATGTSPMAYQWKKNTTAISGATSSSYTTPSETTADNKATFAVSVTNSAGNATSNSATLTVNAGTLLLNGSPSALNFGNVNVSSSSSQNVTLTNAGTSNVTISNVSISGAGFNASGVPTGLILTPGQTATLTATFSPSTAGSMTGSVTVVSNASNSPDAVALSGTGVIVVNHSAALSWTASTSAVIGYNTYSGAKSGGPYTRLNSTPSTGTSYTDSTVQTGLTYYYVVTAVNSAGTESLYSNQVSATIP